jgi:hypothetical protein
MQEGIKWVTRTSWVRSRFRDEFERGYVLLLDQENEVRNMTVEVASIPVADKAVWALRLSCILSSVWDVRLSISGANRNPGTRWIECRMIE